VRFALLNHPSVEAAYLDWKAAAESIAPARSLPDPQLTFQADIADTVMSLMPGVMFGISHSGRRAAAAREAASRSGVAYRAYAEEVARVAAGVAGAWSDLAYIDEELGLKDEAALLVGQSLAIERARYATGAAMGGLAPQARLANQQAVVERERANLEDRRRATRVRFKAALGLGSDDPDPPWPRGPFPFPALPDEETLWRRLAASNPGLEKMRAAVEAAAASADAARRLSEPDFAAGLMANIRANPVVFRPLGSVTLPIWKDKIASSIAAADDAERSSKTRLDAARLALAADLAGILFDKREADRDLASIEGELLPNLARAEESAAAGYQATGMDGFAQVAEIRWMRLDLRLQAAEARHERDAALVRVLSLGTGGRPAAGLLLVRTPDPLESP
jgi:outer membrane protein TolC